MSLRCSTASTTPPKDVPAERKVLRVGSAWFPARNSRVKGEQTIPQGDRLKLELPGGGGFGNPYTREPEGVQEDFKDGLISAESASKHYGVVFHEDGQVNEKATLKMRKNRT